MYLCGRIMKTVQRQDGKEEVAVMQRLGTAELTNGMWVGRGGNLRRNAGFNIAVALLMAGSGF